MFVCFVAILSFKLLADANVKRIGNLAISKNTHSIWNFIHPGSNNRRGRSVNDLVAMRVFFWRGKAASFSVCSNFTADRCRRVSGRENEEQALA